METIFQKGTCKYLKKLRRKKLRRNYIGLVWKNSTIFLKAISLILRLNKQNTSLIQISKIQVKCKGKMERKFHLNTLMFLHLNHSSIGTKRNRKMIQETFKEIIVKVSLIIHDKSIDHVKIKMRYFLMKILKLNFTIFKIILQTITFQHKIWRWLVMISTLCTIRCMQKILNNQKLQVKCNNNHIFTINRGKSELMMTMQSRRSFLLGTNNSKINRLININFQISKLSRDKIIIKMLQSMQMS